MSALLPSLLIPARLATLALCAAAAAPALAASHIMPGLMCVSDGASDRPISGALLNAVVSATGTQKFSCPIIRTEPVSNYASTMSLWINARVNYSYTNFDCVLRATMVDGTVIDSASVLMPPKSSSNGGNWTTGISVTLPPTMVTHTYLRCNVPNVYAGELAGIMSYRVTD